MSALPVPVEHVLLLAVVLFTGGFGALMLRRNLLFVLMALEVMLNACALAFVAAGAHHGQADGQVVYLLILAVAAAEVAVGLALVLQLQKRFRSVDIDLASELHD